MKPPLRVDYNILTSSAKPDLIGLFFQLIARGFCYDGIQTILGQRSFIDHYHAFQE